MQNPLLAARTHEVFARGLDIYEQLADAQLAGGGTTLVMDAARAELCDLLRPHDQLAEDAAFSGVRWREWVDHEDPDVFLGARYALACWLDEIFITDSVWAGPWEAQTIEHQLFNRGQHRGTKFWEQAVKAGQEGAGRRDALEVYLWCYALGFRGKPDAPAVMNKVQWANQTRAALIAAVNKDFPAPGRNPDPPTARPELRGRADLLRWQQYLIGAIVLAVAAAVLLYFH